jgi:hypothetical protein
MRIISFQSEEVVSILEGSKIYLPTPNLCREKRNYESDMEQLGGKFPVWGFSSKYEDGFRPIDFLDSTLLERFRCEMSLGSKGLSNLKVLELEVPSELVKIGLTHNSYEYAVVFPCIDLNWLISVGEVKIVPSSEFDYRYILPKGASISFSDDCISDFNYIIEPLKVNAEDGVMVRPGYYKVKLTLPVLGDVMNLCVTDRDLKVLIKVPVSVTTKIELEKRLADFSQKYAATGLSIEYVVVMGKMNLF